MVEAINSLMETLKGEWPVIHDAPISFFIAVVSLSAIGLLVLRFVYAGRILLLKDQIKNKDRLIKDLRPSKTYWEQLDNIVLTEKVTFLVGQLRETYRHYRDQEDELLMLNLKVKEGLKAVSNDEQEKRRRLLRDNYDSTFKCDAILLRDEILRRIPSLPPGIRLSPGGEYHIDVSMYGSFQDPIQLQLVADDLECLSKNLPVSQSRSRSLISHIWSVIPAAIAGVMRIARWIRQKL